VMLPIEVKVAGIECAAGCSIFFQTVDRLPLVYSWLKSGKSGGQKPDHLLRMRNVSTRYALAVRHRDEPTPYG